MLVKELAEFYDRYFAGSCLLVVRLDGAPNDSPDWITVATAALMATFFETIAIGVLIIALQLEANPVAYRAATPAFIVLLVINWLFGTKRERYREHFRAPKEDRKKLVILATSLNMTIFLCLAVVGYIRIL